jgi:uncharacterized cupredoxin-like copper-binding protein
MRVPGWLAAASLVLPLALSPAAMAATPQVLDVTMTNQADGSQVLTVSPSSAKPGPVVFKVANASSDEVHEFLIVKTDLTPDKFPMTKDGTEVDEKKLKGIHELGDLRPGKSGQLPLTLTAGHYVLFCNQKGHFDGGMHAELNVKA